MNNYNEVIKIAKDLREEYKELTIHQSLDIAAKIQQCEVISRGLLVESESTPVALEAIAMTLGFSPEERGRYTIVDSINDLRDSVQNMKE